MRDAKYSGGRCINYQVSNAYVSLFEGYIDAYVSCFGMTTVKKPLLIIYTREDSGRAKHGPGM